MNVKELTRFGVFHRKHAYLKIMLCQNSIPLAGNCI